MHRILVFVFETGQPLSNARSTERYETIKMGQRKRLMSTTEEEKDVQHGYLGRCSLADLVFFDRG